jgi:hypothetical protein
MKKVSSFEDKSASENKLEEVKKIITPEEIMSPMNMSG